MFSMLRCHYDENCIFTIEAILKHKQVAFMRRKMLFTIFKYLFLFQRYLSDDVIHSTLFWSNMMKKDISANLIQKCLILCGKILLNVLHNLSRTVLLPWQHTGFQPSPIFTPFVFTTTGGMSDECQRYLSHLAELLAVKKHAGELCFHYHMD